MADVAKYMRIYDPSPTDESVTKRKAAAKEVATQLRKTAGTTDLVKLGASIARSFVSGSVPDPLGASVAEAIKKQSPSFIREERELEVVVIAAAGVFEVLEGRDTTATVSRNDILAGALWSALAGQAALAEPKIEQLRKDVLEFARDWCLRRAEDSRERRAFADIPAAAEDDLVQVAKALSAATIAIQTLQHNAVLDREELDIGWWAQGGRSPMLHKAYEGLEPSVRGVVRGMELGILMRRLPATAHHSLTLSGVAEVEPLPLSTVLERLGEHREFLAEKIPARAVVDQCPEVFLLLTAIATGTAEGEGEGEGEGEAENTGDQWAARALLEAGLANLCQTPAAKV
jgi:hypothetical protein